MLQTDRRGLLALAAISPFFGALPAFAQATVAGGDWDLSEIYPDWSAWDAARKAVLGALPRLAAYKGHLGDGRLGEGRQGAEERRNGGEGEQAAAVCLKHVDVSP